MVEVSISIRMAPDVTLWRNRPMVYIKKKEEMIEQNVETNDRGPVRSTFFRFEPWTS
jgi:hypothetical protein